MRGVCILPYIIIGNAFIYCVACQGVDPCDDVNVIQLPGRRKCLTYHNDAKHWRDAASICERQGGSLYRIEEGEIRTGSATGQCLLSTPDTGGKLDFWIGAASQWSPQWFWVNGSYLNPLLTCTQDYTSLAENSFDVCSDHLSVDYCVSVCRIEGAPFTVIEHRPGRLYPCCWCSYRYTGNQSCPFPTYRRQQSDWLSIFSSMPRLGSAIVLESSEALVKTETLCALVNVDTTTIRELSSQSCFTQNYYLCRAARNATNCTLELKGQCVYVGQTFLTWFAARADCRRRGGDLLIVADLVDMFDIIPYIKPKPKRNFWIGAQNHIWDFAPGSAVFSRNENYVESETTCGHMLNQGNTWRWADTSCDSRKPFYCQYDSVKYADLPLDENDDVICPWEINLPVPLPGTTPRPTSRRPTTARPSDVENRDAFPLAAVIAAVVAALLMLLCLLLTLFFIRRRRSKQNRLSKSDRVFGGHRLPKRFYQRWSNAYNYYPDHLSDGGWESISSPHDGVLSDMSIVSAPSPGGYLRDGYENPGLARAYTLASPADLEALYATPKKAGIVRRSTTKGASHNFSTVGQSGRADLNGTSGTTGSGDYLDLDKTMTSIHHGGSPTSKEYMTLAARMNIREDLGSSRSVTKSRPEVALVTNDVDLNFTVNHAVTKQRIGSEHASERTLDEIELPVGTTVEIPKYIPETVLY